MLDAKAIKADGRATPARDNRAGQMLGDELHHLLAVAFSVRHEVPDQANLFTCRLIDGFEP